MNELLKKVRAEYKITQKKLIKKRIKEHYLARMQT
jgi:hypothetical protein